MPSFGELPLPVELTAHVSGTNISGLIYWWDLDGDGTYDLPGGVHTVVTNVYLEIGLHDAGLMVSNSAGETVSVLKEGLVAVAGPDTVYVSLDGGHVFPYTNWSDAATNMEAGLGIAAYGTLVLVSNGTYDLSGELQVNGQVILQGVGGWSNTVLDAGGVSRCLALNHAGAEIDGFTVTGGAADDGAGIMLTDDATVRNCLIVSNNATGRGGGVYCDGSGEILDCTIKENTSGANGGGFYLDRGGFVDRCHIVSNRTLSAGADGGGMFIYRGGSAANSIAFGNLAQDKGGGFYCDRGGLVESCTAAGNSAQYGGGTRCYGGGTVRNTISFYNSAPNGSNNYSSASASYSYTCTAPAIAGEGNITNSPLFVALNAAALRLQHGSQCINTGIDQGWMDGATDLVGNRRIMGLDVDMGAYEYGGLMCTFDTEPITLDAPGEVVFNGFADGTNLSGLVFAWDFENDGEIDAVGGGLNVVTNVYTATGLVSVLLVASNSAGEIATFTGQVDVTIVSAPPYMYVSQSGLHAEPYDTWEKAATNLAAAIDIANDGIAIFVTNGVYGLTSQVLVDKGVTITGVGDRDGVVFDGLDAVRCFYVSHGEAVLSGLTVTRGNAPGSGVAGSGGGLYLTADALVVDCVISNNRANYRGGGVFCDGAGHLTNCVIVSNSTGNDDGGGVLLNAGGRLSECLILDNQAADDGGGVQCEYGGTVLNCRIHRNRANDKGGGVFARPASMVQNCLISDNESSQWGGGYAYRRQGGGSDGMVVNCTIVSNAAATSGGGIRLHDGGIVMNCIVVSNAAPVSENWLEVNTGMTYFNVCTDPSPGVSGIVTADPQFVDFAGGDYRIADTSPCVDTGTNAVAVLGYDLNGVPRPLDGNTNGTPVVDMGAFEFSGSLSDTDGDGMSDLWETETGLDPTDGQGEHGSDADPDGDGLDNGGEFAADTHPFDPESLLEVISVDDVPGGWQVSWRGGIDSSQFVEYVPNIAGATGDWSVVLTNLPPTDTSNSVIDTTTTLDQGFYRIRAVR